MISVINSLIFIAAGALSTTTGPPPPALSSANTIQCRPIDLGNRTCYHNPSGIMKAHPSCQKASCCCDACSAKTGCASWTFFGSDSCNLFKTIGTPNAGDPSCVSGNGSPMPPAPAPSPHPHPGGGWIPPPPPGPACKNCPNIIFSMTDDQDVQLGGWEPMTQTKKLLQNDPNGVFLSEWRIHTPICSPSRSEVVSGRYFHNIKSDLKVPPAKLQGAATGHVNGTLYDGDSFGVHLRAAQGYQVALFGKSNFNTEEGFDRWFQGVQCGYGGGFQGESVKRKRKRERERESLFVCSFPHIHPPTSSLAHHTL